MTKREAKRRLGPIIPAGRPKVSTPTAGCAAAEEPLGGPNRQKMRFQPGVNFPAARSERRERHSADIITRMQCR